MEHKVIDDIGIKHGFSCINIRQVPREVLKTEAGGVENNVRSLLLHKTENICYISRYFLHFCFAFSPMSRERNSTDYAPSRAGKYTSRNGSKSVAPLRTY